MENLRKECHRFWLRLRHAVILISNDRTSASKKINGMALIRTLTVSTTAFERTKEKFDGFRKTVLRSTIKRASFTHPVLWLVDTLLRPCSHVSGQLLSHSIRRKFHRIGTAFTSIWIDFLSCSHVAGYNSYLDKLYADRPCIYTYPFQSYLDSLFTRVYAWRIVHRMHLFPTFKGG